MENQLDKVKIVREDGSVQEADVLLFFNLKENGKDYIIYTFNEKDDKNLVTVYTSEVVKTEDGYKFENVESEEVWSKIKEVMKSVIKENKE
jgi:uncharacterized protein YrzB (UPF0473 family)